MKVKRIIQFTGKDLNDLFKLECVKAVIKDDLGRPILVLWPHMVARTADNPHSCAAVGSQLIEFEGGRWKIA